MPPAPTAVHWSIHGGNPSLLVQLGQVFESSTDPEATPKAKLSSLPPPSQAGSRYAQALARFAFYTDPQLPEALRNRCYNQPMIPSLMYGFLVPGGDPHIMRIGKKLKLNTLPKNPSQPAAGRSMTEYDARTRLAKYIKTRWPIELFRDSSNFEYSLFFGCVLDNDGAPTGTALVLYSNTSPNKDRDMFHRSASMFGQVLEVTKSILRLPKKAEPRWFYHPASSRSSRFKFDLDRCFRHDYPPVRNTSDSSV
ncbi:hypothetical protein C8Q73DRAFT_675821 [Cubamyces lactineus]|nr:hypothetical protein C8Q73DRAFT_675821 [Cubamyces lactineus]